MFSLETNLIENTVSCGSEAMEDKTVDAGENTSEAPENVCGDADNSHVEFSKQEKALAEIKMTHIKRSRRVKRYVCLRGCCDQNLGARKSHVT